jgi:hypothetical protein
MKKVFYIICFTFLGILFQFLLHAGIEIWYIKLLVADFQKYSLGFSFSQLVLIHHIATVILLIAGALFGFWQGKYWWKRLYENKK